MSRIPEVAAALVSQVLVTDSQTQLRTLANIFSVLNTPVLPFATSIGFYVKMIDGEGPYLLRIRLVRLRDDKTILDLPEQQVEWAHPLQPLEIGINMLLVPIEEEGLHEFQVYMDDVYVGRSAFSVVKLNIPAQIGGNP